VQQVHKESGVESTDSRGGSSNFAQCGVLVCVWGETSGVKCRWGCGWPKRRGWAEDRKVVQEDTIRWEGKEGWTSRGGPQLRYGNYMTRKGKRGCSGMS
jgi:hypothetical protein